MKFPIKVLSRSRWERLKDKSIQMEREALEAGPLHRRLQQLQSMDLANDSLLNHDSLSRLDPAAAFVAVDVGANQGDWSLALVALFPKARVLAIEADPKTHETLRQRTAHRPEIQAIHLAIASKNGTAVFHSHQMSLLSSLLELPDAQGQTTAVRVPMAKLDDVMEQYASAPIRMIKIDTEGNDLDALCGAEKLLATDSLEYVVVEYGIDPADRRHVHINSLIRFMEGKRFCLALLGGLGIHGAHLYGNALFARIKLRSSAVTCPK